MQVLLKKYKNSKETYKERLQVLLQADIPPAFLNGGNGTTATANSQVNHRAILR
jgi:hypothetical protein